MDHDRELAALRIAAVICSLVCLTFVRRQNPYTKRDFLKN